METVAVTMPKAVLDLVDSTWPRTRCASRSEFVRNSCVLIAAQVERHLERKAEREQQEAEDAQPEEAVDR